jgi:hypothetical protein
MSTFVAALRQACFADPTLPWPYYLAYSHSATTLQSSASLPTEAANSTADEEPSHTS